MTLPEFASLVETMRHEQKRFFRGEKSAIEPAKIAERKVDEALREMADGQKKLFESER